jgi:hypothetical protein
MDKDFKMVKSVYTSNYDAIVNIMHLYKIERFDLIKPFLILLNALPETIRNVGEKDIIYTDDIPLDENIVKALRKIGNG